VYELKVTSHFAAAHRLREFYGKCESLHGHNWFVEVRVRADSLDKTGLAMDFGALKRRLNEVLEIIDHKYLNELPHFAEANPSSENIALFIFSRLEPLVAQDSENRARLCSVSAWESDNACATYISEKGA
jgi:6-pyruvoyltetrahydropterin/6-carboxytetrahydropterin synthase